MTLRIAHLFSHRMSNNQKAKILHAEGFGLLVCILLVSQVFVHSLQTGVGPLPAVLGFSSSITADQVIQQTNAQRQSAGLGSLSVNQQLNAAALAKGNDMCAKQYWAHISPTGTTPWVFMKNASYKYAVAGENLARDFSDTDSMVAAWMASPTHKANIINTRYKEIGIAVVNCSLLGSDTALVVQMFGTQLVSGASAGKVPSGKTAVAVNPQVKAFETQEPSEPIPTEIPIEQVQGQESVPDLIVQAEPQLQLENSAPESSSLRMFTPLQMQKSILIAILALVCVALVIDMWLVERHNVIRVSSRSLGHILFFVGIFCVVLVVKAGVTL